MCLYTIDEKTKKGRRYGYKGFDKSGEKLCGLCMGDFTFPEEQWYTDPNTKTIDGRYPAGFHICRFKEHARDWGGATTRKVYYREVVASGDFLGEPVYIARQIWITKEDI